MRERIKRPTISTQSPDKKSSIAYVPKPRSFRPLTNRVSLLGNQAASSKSMVMRKCAFCETGSPCSACGSEEKKLQRKAQRGDAGAHDAASIDDLGPGRPLDAEARSYFEPRFAADFSGVRIHTGDRAASAALAVNAYAFTVGNRIAFGAGQYNPGSLAGRRLIAHELTHVVQQTNSSTDGSTIHRQAKSPSLDLDAQLQARIQQMEQLTALIGSSMGNGEFAARMHQHSPRPLQLLQAGLEQLRKAASGDQAYKQSVLSAFNRSDWEEIETQVPDASGTTASMPGLTVVAEQRPEQIATKSFAVSNPHDPAELEADRVASTVVNDSPVQVGERSAGATIHRQFRQVVETAKETGQQVPLQYKLIALALGAAIGVVIWAFERRPKAPAEGPRPLAPPPAAPPPGTEARGPRSPELKLTPPPYYPVPVMPSGLSRADQERWKECNELHDTYKATQIYSSINRLDLLEDAVTHNRATPKQFFEFCSLVSELIEMVERLHTERLQYIRNNCDQFDWFNRGRTAAERLASHQEELDNVSARLRNLRDLYKRFCP
jgi:hypothetical protein